MSDERITMTDARKAGFCALGVKRWFEAKDIDFRSFIANGIAADDERLAGDAHVERILRKKAAG